MLRPSTANAGEDEYLRKQYERRRVQEYYDVFDTQYKEARQEVGFQRFEFGPRQEPYGPGGQYEYSENGQVRTQVYDWNNTDPDALEKGFERPPMKCNDAQTIEEVASLIKKYGLTVPDDQKEYPRWPTIYGGVDVNTGKALAGPGQPGRITSYMQSKRKITANGTTSSRNHNGIDIGIATGVPCLAVLDGVVVLSKLMNNYGGATIVIRHEIAPGKYIWAGYCHMRALLVQKGAQVKKGQCVGLSGGVPGDWGAGRSTGAHLHFQINLVRPGAKNMSNYINPMKFFSTKIQNLSGLTGGI